MRQVLGILEGTEARPDRALLIRDGSRVELSPYHQGETDVVLETLLRGRNERVGNGSAEGEGVFDFRYGPFTGGLGETGIIHLSTYGERILGVDVDLRMKHRGIEEGLVGQTPEAAIGLAEQVCGNFAFSHAHAFARAFEGATGISLTESGERLAIVGVELERVYNHLHAIGRLAEAAAQKVLAAHLSSLFERALRLNGLFTGSRYLRRARIPGGVVTSPRFDVRELGAESRRVREEFGRLFRASLSNRNYLDRLHNIAIVKAELAGSRGLTGPSLRACGVGEDLRDVDPMYGGRRAVVRSEGDSLARMEVRAEETLESLNMIEAQLEKLGKNDPSGAVAATAPGKGRAGSDPAIAVGATEGPSGVIVWVVEVAKGSVRRAYASTPSLFGYQVFSEALTGHIFTDFPFALDSFGLSFADAAR